MASSKKSLLAKRASRSLSKRSSASRANAISVLSDVRRGDILQVALKNNHVSYKTFRKYAKSAVTQQCPGGVCSIEKSDRLVSPPMLFPTEKGAVTITVKGSKARSIIGSYWADVEAVLHGADPKRLDKYFGRAILTSDKKTHFFVTDVKTLKRLYKDGDLQFKEIYTSKAA